MMTDHEKHAIILADLDHLATELRKRFPDVSEAEVLKASIELLGMSSITKANMAFASAMERRSGSVSFSTLTGSPERATLEA